ncbi:CUB domain containing protein 2 [Desmophyllum pertusum]|uniref:CUB domain containing protein 2 n=1 Tax=Desmophyllum pertusum TaxID=174260 RepID=A0A9W9ZV95_9CNID|nr:CUB domain containing protein 2 [Desmophyllum pertusum]
MDCDYLVRIPQNMTMDIDFIYFYLEVHSSCRYDYLKIINDGGQVVSTYCGQKTGHHVLLSGDHVVIKFHSDGSVVRRGFLINFTAGPHGCNPLTNDKRLKSPGYPNNYPNDTDCTSSVPIPQGMMDIHFIEFDLEYSIRCRSDYLKITNEMNQEFGEDRYCGKQRGQKVSVTGKYALLKFHSDSENQTRGFEMYFAAVPPCKYNEYAHDTLS